MSTVASILEGLNEQQQCAVCSPSPVLQVLAPPGSGKTKTLTARVAYLIAHHGIKPYNMIVCTFTVKAAREMKERIKSFVGEDVEKQLNLGTFHRIARLYLLKYGSFIGLEKNFGVADTSDSTAILKRIVKEGNYQQEPGKLRSRISSRKSQASKITKAKAQPGPEQQEFDTIFDEYNKRLRNSNLLDYDDLLLKCVQLLREHPECVANVEAILIDEFQDTNNVQYDLMTLFAFRLLQKTSDGFNSSITIVGDPDQSIYSFRAAEIKNLGKMQAQYIDTQVIHLEENYRSSGAILSSALQVIEQDKARPVKKLLATHGIGEKPVLRRLGKPVDEAEWLVGEIQRLTQLSGGLLQHDDFAVLLRSAALSRHIEAQLGKCGIPYRMVGGNRFFDKAEIKVLLDYLRVVSQPTHSDALVRVVNVPRRRIGEETVTKLLHYAEKNGRTLWEIVLDITQDRRKVDLPLKANQVKGLEDFVRIIFAVQKKMNTGCSIALLLEAVLEKLSYRQYLKDKYGQKEDDFESRWSNVEELMQHARELIPETLGLAAEPETNDGSLDDGNIQGDDGGNRLDQARQTSPDYADILQEFLTNIALSTEREQKKDDGQVPIKVVTISTIHAAKGLEWPIVFIPAAYNGSIPHSRADDTDEERRLLYVGMTRAKGLLYLSYPMLTATNDPTTRSNFLDLDNVGRFFNTKGPSLLFSDIQDLAKILRRPRPEDAALRTARAQTERKEDNLFDEYGIRRDEFDHGEYYANRRKMSWQSSRSSENVLAYQAPLKRHLTSDGSSSFEKRRRDMQSGPKLGAVLDNKPFKPVRPMMTAASDRPFQPPRPMAHSTSMMTSLKSAMTTTVYYNQSSGNDMSSFTSLNRNSSLNTGHVPEHGNTVPSFQSARNIHGLQAEARKAGAIAAPAVKAAEILESGQENAHTVKKSEVTTVKNSSQNRPGRTKKALANQSSITSFFAKGGAG